MLPCPSYNYAPGTKSSEETSEQGSYLFTNFEAGKMKTWVVRKITSKQKLRKRIMVIDRDEVFINHMMSFWLCPSCSSRSQTYIDIASINSIVMERDPPNSFTIKFTDDYYSEDEEPDAENSRSGKALRSRYDGGAEVHCRERFGLLGDCESDRLPYSKYTLTVHYTSCSASVCFPKK